WYFAVAMVLFGLQLVFGLLSATKYLGPDPLLNILPFDVTKVIHTNLLIVWVLTGFMGATYWMVPDESRTELHSTKLAYIQLVLWTLMGVTAVIGYLFGYGTGNKLLEQPLPHKIVIVICMLIFLYNIGMTIKTSVRFTTTEGVLLLGLVSSAVLFFPALLHYENYTVSIFYRWWTIHLWVEGVWMMIMGAFLAYLLIRLSGADREVLEKWLYVIVGLVFIAGILGTAHHYYWVGVPYYWLPIGGFFSALEPLAIVGMAMYAYSAMRRSGLAHPTALDPRQHHLHPVRRGPAGLGPYLAEHQQMDPRHADHRHARSRRLLWRLCHDRAGDDHLRTAVADQQTPGARHHHRLLGVLAAAGRHVRHDPVLRHGRDRPGVSGTDHGHGLPGCAAENPDPLRDADLHREYLRHGRGAVHLRLLQLPTALRDAGQRADGARRARRPGGLRWVWNGPSAAWLHARRPMSPGISRQAMKSRCSSSATHAAWQSCSRARPAAARPVSSSTWPGAWAARW